MKTTIKIIKTIKIILTIKIRTPKINQINQMKVRVINYQVNPQKKES
jgi:hypothetical protein